ncbi:MAG: hypothetical protein Q8888_01985 [Vigna little leaf phytoplasma]|nr:hypothetical protein [Vigna little leaf phytoplasma]
MKKINDFNFLFKLRARMKKNDLNITKTLLTTLLLNPQKQMFDQLI